MDYLNYNVYKFFAGMGQLNSLNLSGIQLTNSSMICIGQSLPALESINLRGCFQVGTLPYN